MAEVDVAKPVVRWLLDRKWQVYQEVQVRYGGGIADIVATRGNLLWVVEVKTSRSLKLLEQILDWRRHANLLAVAVPPGLWTPVWREILEHYGVGQFRSSQSADLQIVPHVFRTRSDKLWKALCEEQKTFAEAGNNQGRRFTPFQKTVMSAFNAAKQSPGLPYKEWLALVEHHYESDKTARYTLKKWIEAGIVPGVELRNEGGVLRVYPRLTEDGEGPILKVEANQQEETHVEGKQSEAEGVGGDSPGLSLDPRGEDVAGA